MAIRNGLGVQCHRLQRLPGGKVGTYKRPFMSITPADQDLIECLVEESPDLTIAELRAAVRWAPDIHTLCDRHIAEGWGDTPAAVMCRPILPA